jgi:hypothetical protein
MISISLSLAFLEIFFGVVFDGALYFRKAWPSKYLELEFESEYPSNVSSGTSSYLANGTTFSMLPVTDPVLLGLVKRRSSDFSRPSIISYFKEDFFLESFDDENIDSFLSAEAAIEVVKSIIPRVAFTKSSADHWWLVTSKSNNDFGILEMFESFVGMF